MAIMQANDEAPPLWAAFITLSPVPDPTYTYTYAFTC